MIDLVMLLERSPGWLWRLGERVGLGMGLAGRIADTARFRFSSADVPETPGTAKAELRVAVGPANSAGQAFAWARALERSHPDLKATSMYGIGANDFRARVDLQVPVAVYQRSAAWHDRFEGFLRSQTHVVWESGLPMLGRSLKERVAGEVRLLEGAGVHGALLFHGSDIRPPEAHAAVDPWSPFRSGRGPVRAIAATVARNQRLIRELDIPVFVSTPDLLRWQPTATWCPVVVDPAAWSAARPEPRAEGPLVVVHVPSQRWLKGTDLIEPVARRLEAEGVIRYRQVVGVPHAAMPELYAQADVVLDQFVLGIYGVAACEAMAAGALVMSHVDDFTRAKVRELTGLELPVLEANLGSIEGLLRTAAADREAFGELRAAGPAFVAHVHDGCRSATALETFIR